LTGKKFSEQRAEWKSTAHSPRSPAVFGLARNTEDLHGRIRARVDEMFRRGLVEETRTLLKSGLDQNKTAMQAIGYRQVVEHLRGERNLSDTIELVKTKTRQFAKRQLTWFRRYGDCEWVEWTPGQAADAVAQAVLARWTKAV